MKISTLSLMALVTMLSSHISAQSTSPDYHSPLCPTNGIVSFQLTDPSDYANLSLSACVNCTIITNIDGNGFFTMTFSDAPSPKVTLTDLSSGMTWPIVFNISSLKGITPTPAAGTPLFPSNLNYEGLLPPGYQAGIAVPYCYGAGIPFYGPQVFYQYNNSSYGVAMTTYQWHIPKGWSLSDGSTVTLSTGGTISTAGNNVGVIPDAFTASGDIEYWVLNNCGASWTPSNHLKVYCTRYNASSLSITVNGSSNLNITCGSSTPVTFNTTGLSCATSYQWTAAPGWLYNGSPVTGPITTTTPTLTLDPDPNGTPGNVTVAYYANGAAIPGDSYTEYVTVVPQVPNIPITGPTLLCSSSSTGTYSISNIPTRSTISWTTSSNMQIQSGQGTSSVVVQPTTNSGYGTVQATVSNPCFQNSVSPTMQVMIGAPQPSLLTVVSQGPQVCPNVPVSFGARYNASCTDFLNGNITNVTWSVSPRPEQIQLNSGQAGCGKFNSSGALIYFSPAFTMYNVIISATNTCGSAVSSNPYVVTYMFSCPNSVSPEVVQGTAQDILPTATSRFIVAPNPTMGRVQVGVTRGSVSADQSQPSVLKRIDVYNTVGVLIKSLSYGTGITGTTYVDLTGTPSGIYILSILTDKGRFSEKVELIN